MIQCELLNGLNRMSEEPEVLQEALALYRACGDVSGEIDSLNLLSHVSFFLGDKQKAMETAHQALELKPDHVRLPIGRTPSQRAEKTASDFNP